MNSFRYDRTRIGPQALQMSWAVGDEPEPMYY